MGDARGVGAEWGREELVVVIEAMDGSAGRRGKIVRTRRTCMTVAWRGGVVQREAENIIGRRDGGDGDDASDSLGGKGTAAAAGLRSISAMKLPRDVAMAVGKVNWRTLGRRKFNLGLYSDCFVDADSFVFSFPPGSRIMSSAASSFQFQLSHAGSDFSFQALPALSNDRPIETGGGFYQVPKWASDGCGYRRDC